MKLVYRDVSTDGCTFSCDVNIPLTYESKEKFLHDWELAFIEAFLNKKYDFTFHGIDWETHGCYWYGKGGEQHITLPNILTLDEWFNEFEVKG